MSDQSDNHTNIKYEGGSREAIQSKMVVALHDADCGCCNVEGQRIFDAPECETNYKSMADAAMTILDYEVLAQQKTRQIFARLALNLQSEIERANGGRPRKPAEGVCVRCDVIGPMFYVPDEAWDVVSESGKYDGILCWKCFYESYALKVGWPSGNGTNAADKSVIDTRIIKRNLDLHSESCGHDMSQCGCSCCFAHRYAYALLDALAADSSGMS